MKLLISPHSDDAALFANFTLQLHRPKVIVVYDSYVQPERGYLSCGKETRRAEDMQALTGILGCEVEFLGLDDRENDAVAVSRALAPIAATYGATEVWAPATEIHGHIQHNIVSEACSHQFDHLRFYYTYTRALGKTIFGTPVPYTGEMVYKKLQSLLCYRSQILTDGVGCYPHFVRSLEEYTA